MSSDIEKALVSMAEKLIEVEMDLREDDEEEEPAKKYSPSEISQIAVRLVSEYKKTAPEKLTKKEFKAFVSKNKQMF